MQWVELTIRTTTQGADAMAQVLMDEGIAGVSIEDAADLQLYRRKSDEWDYIDETIFADHGDVVYVKGYIAMEKKVYGAINSIMERAARIAEMDEPGFDPGAGEVLVKLVQDEDWAENWKQYYKPFTVGERLAVKPCWEAYDAPGRTVVELEPGAAFGTGQHETTLMCLSLCERYVTPDSLVLDIGCGTGILGIAAVKLGAQFATSVDRDEVAVSACKHNAALNGCLDRMEVLEGNLADKVHGKYDLIFANIVADAVIALLPQAKHLMAKGATIVCSGIILEREADVLQAAQAQGLCVDARCNRGEWVALALKAAGKKHAEKAEKPPREKRTRQGHA